PPRLALGQQPPGEAQLALVGLDDRQPGRPTGVGPRRGGPRGGRRPAGRHVGELGQQVGGVGPGQPPGAGGGGRGVPGRAHGAPCPVVSEATGSEADPSDPLVAATWPRTISLPVAIICWTIRRYSVTTARSPADSEPASPAPFPAASGGPAPFPTPAGPASTAAGGRSPAPSAMRIVGARSAGFTPVGRGSPVALRAQCPLTIQAGRRPGSSHRAGSEPRPA